jgi:hypothetical protein
MEALLHREVEGAHAPHVLVAVADKHKRHRGALRRLVVHAPRRGPLASKAESDRDESVSPSAQPT